MYCPLENGPLENCRECSYVNYGHDCNNHRIMPGQKASHEKQIRELLMDVLKAHGMQDAEEMLLTFQVVGLLSNGQHEVVFELLL